MGSKAGEEKEFIEGRSRIERVPNPPEDSEECSNNLEVAEEWENELIEGRSRIREGSQCAGG